jgi:hypothetical protein
MALAGLRTLVIRIIKPFSCIHAMAAKCLTKRAKGIFRMSRLVLRWYLRISRSATVPGRKRCGFSAPIIKVPVKGQQQGSDGKSQALY